MTAFDDDTAVRPVGEGLFEARIDESWRIVRGANGGHLAAVLLRAMTATVADTDRVPRTLTVHFARAPEDRSVSVETSIERTGRSMSTASARMRQDDKLIAVGLCAFLTERSGPEFADIAMPAVPAPEDIAPVPDRDDFPFGRHFDYRPATGLRFVSPDAAAEGNEDDPAEIAVWMRLREPQPLDHMVATQLCDSFAPAVFVKLGTGGGGAGVPTIEMTYHYREMLPPEGASDDDWCLGVFRTSLARGGFIEEDGWLWSRRGTLVAQSRQLAILT